MNKKTIWIGVVIVVILLIVTVSKSSKRGDVTTTTKEPIKIGVVTSLTGAAAPWGEYGKKGVDLAVKIINDRGGINGRQVTVIMEDDRTDGKVGVSAYNKLVSIDKVDGVIGGVFDFTAQPLIPLAVTNKLTLISPANFQITGGFDMNEYTFVMMPAFGTVIRHLKDYIASSTIKKLAVVHFKSTFGGEIAKTLNDVSKELGRGEIVDESYTQIGNNDFRTTITKLKKAGVDAVFLDMLANDPVNFLKRAREQGFKPTIITYNGALDSFANETDKSLLEGAVILNWELNSQEFNDLFMKEYGVIPAKSADKWFDAVYVMATAISKNTDRTKVANYIETNSFVTPNAAINFTAVHAPLLIPVETAIMKGGVLVPWGK